MHRKIFLFKVLMFIILNFFCFYLKAQNILILEKAGTYRNIKYYEGDYIHFKTINNGLSIRYEGFISKIKDSSIVISDFTKKVIPIKDITVIYRERRLIEDIRELSINFGIVYVSLTAFNNAINNVNSILDRNTICLSCSSIVFGILLSPIRVRKYKVKKLWRLKILDFSSL